MEYKQFGFGYETDPGCKEDKNNLEQCHEKL